MLVASFLKWWYGVGLKNRLERLIDALSKTTDFFSIDLLAKNFFQPFRMIDSEKLEKGALEDKLRNLFDRTISRIIGAGIRSVVLLAGTVAFLLHATWAILVMLAWFLMPFLPVACVLAYVWGVDLSWLK